MRLRLLSACVVLAVVSASCAVPLSQINKGDPVFYFDLNVAPKDAEVYLDGQFIGKAESYTCDNRCLTVTKGAHVLTFKAEGRMNETLLVYGRETLQSLDVVMKPVPEKSK